MGQGSGNLRICLSGVASASLSLASFCEGERAIEPGVLPGEWEGPLGHVHLGFQTPGAPARWPLLQVSVQLVAPAGALVDAVRAPLRWRSPGSQFQKSFH